MKKAIIFDLDGTLADNEHRQIYAQSKKPDWEKFFSGIQDDLPNQSIVDLYETLRESGKFFCILVSGRPTTYLEQTQDWLNKYSITYDKLLMRAAGDRRPDFDVKQDILNQLLKEGVQIAFVVDDRSPTVKMWRLNGITCLQCAQHDY